jgi:hypothetical protein
MVRRVSTNWDTLLPNLLRIAKELDNLDIYG